MTEISLPNPKICIVFNSGSAGDFLINLLVQSTDTRINDSGSVDNIHNAELFKHACEFFYKNNWDTTFFYKIGTVDIVNTHYYYPQLKELFPECKFYYIDDYEYVDITVDLYIKKRIYSESKTLLDWLHETNSFPQVKKIKDISDEHLKKIMINDWLKNLDLWKNFNLSRIGFDEILDKNKCRNLIKSIVKYNLNEDIFSGTYDRWYDKNKSTIEKRLNTTYDKRI
jgi:hypothetical protein